MYLYGILALYGTGKYLIIYDRKGPCDGRSFGCDPGFCWREASAGSILCAKIVCWEAYILEPMYYRSDYDHDDAMSRIRFDCF